MKRLSRWIATIAPMIYLLCVAVPASAQSGAKNGEWRTYGGDLASTRYSALDQINAENFNKLAVAWRFKTDSLGPRPEFKFESTPLMVKGVLYSTGGTRRAVVALDAATGELLWMHSENEGDRGSNAPRQLSGHGLAYWTDGKEERILYVTPGYRLIALNAKTGNPVPSFGVGGVVDLKKDDDQNIDLITGEVGLHSTPIVARNVVIVGAAHLTGGVPHSRKNVKGYVRGFDVRTGKRLWIFHTIPLPNEFGNDTWLKESWAYTGNTGVWGQISVDETLGLVYLPVELPTGDYFGGDRPGNGLFGETLVAVDLETGKTVAQRGVMNPQIAYGEDVISRISYASHGGEAAQRLQRRVIDTLNQALREFCNDLSINPEQIVEMVVAGNTAMHHFFAGLPVQQLGQAPYLPAATEPLHLAARDLDLQIAAEAAIYTPPNIAGYVGGDHVAMLVGIDAGSLKSGPPFLAIDIGTNTELTLSVHGRLLTCSCASGPAFEGAHIRHGMRAAPGAIERVLFERGGPRAPVQWSADGKWVYFSQPSGNGSGGTAGALQQLIVERS
jgi:hypothetical protein